MEIFKYLLRSVRKSSTGSVLITVAGGIVAFCVVAAIAIDISRVYLQSSKVEEAIEASGMAGIREMQKYKTGVSALSSTQETAVRDATIAFAAKNGLTVKSSEVIIAGSRVYVDTRPKIEFTFAKMLGMDSIEVKTKKIVELDASGKAKVVKEAQYKVMPWAIPHRTLSDSYSVTAGYFPLNPSGTYQEVSAFTPGQEYVLKLGSGPSSDTGVPSTAQVLIPMGSEGGVNDQWSVGFKRAYGLVSWLLKPKSSGGGGLERVRWLLGYRGGSFMFEYNQDILMTLGAMATSGSGTFGSAGILVDPNYFMWVKYQIVNDPTQILSQTPAPIDLTSAPRVGIYSQSENVLTRTLYDACIPYDLLYDSDITSGKLTAPTSDPSRPYTWLMAHHEDFTQSTNIAVDDPIPYISMWDTNAADGLQTGPCSLLYVRGWGWASGGAGIQKIRLYFDDNITRPTSTGTYSGSTVTTDTDGSLVVNANDSGSFEVYINLPPKPNGRYLVYCRAGATEGSDFSSNYLNYNVINSTIVPTIAAINNVSLNNVIANGSTVRVTGTNFGAYQPDIILKFDGVIPQTLTKTMTYLGCSVNNSLITADPSGNFEVTFTLGDIAVGTHEVYASINDTQSNKVILYNTLSQSSPYITINDNVGLPQQGPKDHDLYVTGANFGANTGGINIKFDSSVMNVENTGAYPGVIVFGGSVTSNIDGNFQVKFDVPYDRADGTYEVKAYYGASSSTEAQLYTILTSATPEITLANVTGGAATGPTGCEVYCEGFYFASNMPNLKLTFGTQELNLTETPKYSDDTVTESDKIKANGDGKFQLKFTVPNLPNGVYSVFISQSGVPVSTVAQYTVNTPTPDIALQDTSAPYDQGPSYEKVRILGSGYGAGASGIQVYFNGQLAAVSLPSGYSGGASLSGGLITADQYGSFEVEITMPLVSPGTYGIYAANTTKCSPTRSYVLGSVSTIYVSASPTFTTLNDSFSRTGTTYLKVLTSEIDKLNVVNSYFTVECNYHSASPHLSPNLPLTNNGDFTYTATFNWADYANVHNGTWLIKFFLSDAAGKTYTPSKLINITGTNVATESSIVSAAPNLSNADFAIKNTGTLYYKIQSHLVEPGMITEESATLKCALNNANSASGHYYALNELQNNLDGTYNGSCQLASISPTCHLGLWHLNMRISDSIYHTFSPSTRICLFSNTGEIRLILSHNNYFVEPADHSVSSGPQYAYNTTGKIYFIFNARPAGIDGSSPTIMQYWLDFAETTTNFRSGSYTTGPHNRDPFMVSSPYYSLTNNMNGTFSGEIALNAVGINKRSWDRYFRLHAKVVQGGVTAELVTLPQGIDVNNTQGSGVAQLVPHSSPSLLEAVGETAKSLIHGFKSKASNATNTALIVMRNVHMKAYNLAESFRKPFVPWHLRDENPLARMAAASRFKAYMAERGLHSVKRFEDPEMERDLKMIMDPKGIEVYNRFRVNDVFKNYDHGYAAADRNRKLFAAAGDKRSAASSARAAVGDLLSGSLLAPESAYAAPAGTYNGKHNIVHAIRTWVVSGGYYFGMCYATESTEKVLAMDASGNQLLLAGGGPHDYDFQYTFLFGNDPTGNGFNPDAATGSGAINSNNSGNFTLVNQLATTDKYKRPLAAVQNHKATFPGFVGATTSFNSLYLKAYTGPTGAPTNVLGKVNDSNYKYIASEYGNGWVTYLAGHDPKLIETYRLILDNVLMGSYSPYSPQATSASCSYGVIDWDNSSSTYELERDSYKKLVLSGHSPSMFGKITTTYPGDISSQPLVDSVSSGFQDDSINCVNDLYAADTQTPISSGASKRSYNDYDDGSSRFVLVPIVSTFMTNGSLTCVNTINTLSNPSSIYHVKGRDKVRIKAYALFFLDDIEAHTDSNTLYNETGSHKYGEVRGKFVGYLQY